LKIKTSPGAVVALSIRILSSEYLGIFAFALAAVSSMMHCFVASDSNGREAAPLSLAFHVAIITSSAKALALLRGIDYWLGFRFS
jgi:hypothetical protein